MTFPLDIHTHRLPSRPGEAIVNFAPDAFAPQAGGWYSVGVHPWQASEAETERALALLERLVLHPQVVAVGEAGLDRLAAAPMPVQEAVFCRQARLAEAVGKPLIIHLVKAADELLRLRRVLRPTVPWVIHGFRGKEALAAMWMRHGCLLSFGARYREEALCGLPADRLLLETDESGADIDGLCERAALLRRTTPADLRERVEKNVAGIFFRQ